MDVMPITTIPMPRKCKVQIKMSLVTAHRLRWVARSINMALITSRSSVLEITSWILVALRSQACCRWMPIRVNMLSGRIKATNQIWPSHVNLISQMSADRLRLVIKPGSISKRIGIIYMWKLPPTAKPGRYSKHLPVLIRIRRAHPMAGRIQVKQMIGKRKKLTFLNLPGKRYRYALNMWPMPWSTAKACFWMMCGSMRSTTSPILKRMRAAGSRMDLRVWKISCRKPIVWVWSSKVIQRLWLRLS